jgi:hypothetical protein
MSPEPRKEIPRHELVAAALELGIERPDLLTQAELQHLIREVSEGHVASSEARSALGRGWFSVARHLVASMIEKGLNLPTAARVLRDTVRSVPPERPPWPTVTLAQIYIAQGHAERAVATLEQVLRRDPKNPKAARLLAELSPKSTHTGSAPQWITRDALVVVHTRAGAQVYWEITRATWDQTRELELKLSLVSPAETGAIIEHQIVPVPAACGQYVATLDSRVIVRAALGAERRGRWLPIAVASVFRRDRSGFTPEFTPRKHTSDDEVLVRGARALFGQTEILPVETQPVEAQLTESQAMGTERRAEL